MLKSFVPTVQLIQLPLFTTSKRKHIELYTTLLHQNKCKRLWDKIRFVVP